VTTVAFVNSRSNTIVGVAVVENEVKEAQFLRAFRLDDYISPKMHPSRSYCVLLYLYVKPIYWRHVPSILRDTLRHMYKSIILYGVPKFQYPNYLVNKNMIFVMPKREYVPCILFSC